LAKRNTSLTVNGRYVDVESEHLDWTLVRYLRQSLGLTGTKQSCDNEGTCGTCLVILDGKPRRACLEKMSSLDGAKVETIESLRVEDGVPHPILQTVIKDGIFQCGYCAPGAIMAAKALLDATDQPSDKEIVRALSPVICRCVGLNRMDVSIRRAAAVIRRELDSEWTPEDTADEYQALAKLTGELEFTDDLAFPGMLYCQALRAHVPHAKVVKVDVSKAEHMPGVVRVLTAKDVPGENIFGLISSDQPVFCDDVVRYVGDTLALVVAEEPEQAEAALKEIDVELEPLPIVVDPEQAMAPGAPVLHERLREAYPETPNVLKLHTIRKGDPQVGFSQADTIVEAEYEVPFVDHAYMELECSIGVPESDGTITVYVGSQGPLDDRRQVAAALGVEEEQIRIAHRTMGGGFGGKEDIAGQIHVALAAMVTGHPVKSLWDRAESFLVRHKRHAAKMRYKMGATKDGKLVAAEVVILGDTGAYASAGEAVLFRSASFACGPYAVPHAHVDAYTVHTNNPPCGAFRGFGGTQVTFGSEIHVQKLIDALGMDPIEFRLKNALDFGDATITGDVVTKVSGAAVRACLEAVKSALEATPRPELGPDEKLGIGIAASYKNVGLGSGIPDGAGAQISLEPEGYFLLRHGAADMGQGSNEAMAIIASRALGVPRALIRVHAADTKVDPPGGMTTASRATFVSGNATLLASRGLREQLWEAVASEFPVSREDLEIHDGVFVEKGTDRSFVSLEDLARNGERFEYEATYDAPTTQPPPARVSDGQEPPEKPMHFAYCYGAQAALVAVNEKSGDVRVIKLIAAHDVGRPISVRGCIGQIEGAAIQGIGYALTESFPTEAGIPQVSKFRELGLLRLRDLPEIQPILIEDPHPQGPFGARGMGELAVSVPAPAIVNAIHDAVSVWIDEIPVSREKLRLAIQAKQSNGGKA